jgi:hypothetical protein
MTIIDLHQRTVEIFTILEMLLLPSEDASIIDSVCKYRSKLAVKDVEERQQIIKLLKRMYMVRSSMIHHAKRKRIDLNDLKQLQTILFFIIHNLILKLNAHLKKESVLAEIDLEILKAY